MTSEIGFDDFQRLAADPTLSKYERIGFPDSYREGFETAIFSDIVGKLTNLCRSEQRVADIGPGCSDLPRLLIEHCQTKGSALTLIDGSEMLRLLPDPPHVRKVAALFPNCGDLVSEERGTFNVLLCYSVLQYVVRDTSLLNFLDSALSLLAPGGQMLIGDIPNNSMRRRFFSSETGKKFHREFMKVNEDPVVESYPLQHGEIDDSVVTMIIERARAAGFHGFVVPQAPDLPMSNRREDVLIVRP